MERRLAAILVADMASYSRLMERDEEGVIERQKTHRHELIDPEITSHGGTGVEKAPGLDVVWCWVDEVEENRNDSLGALGTVGGIDVGVAPVARRLPKRAAYKFRHDIEGLARFLVHQV